MMKSARAERVGVLARSLLRDGTTLRVMAVFDRSLYARDDGGQWLCLLEGSLEPGPLHLLAADLPVPLRSATAPGEVLAVAGGWLAGAEFRVDIAGAALWTPAEWGDQPPPRGFVAEQAIPALVRAAPVGGLFRAILAGDPDPTGDPLETALRREAARGLAELAVWLGDGGAGPAPQGLLGLGPGLTPSGDDMVAGALLALHALGRRDAARALLGDIGPLLETRTNAISAAHIRAAGLGQAAAVFHDCLAAIGAGRALSPELIGRVGRVGHSSGWDALLGMLWTLRAADAPIRGRAG